MISPKLWESISNTFKNVLRIDEEATKNLALNEPFPISLDIKCRVVTVANTQICIIIDKLGSQPLTQILDTNSSNFLVQLSNFLDTVVLQPEETGAPIPTLKTVPESILINIGFFAGVTAVTRLETTCKQFRSYLNSNSAVALWQHTYNTLQSQLSLPNIMVISSSISARDIIPRTVKKLKQSCQDRILHKASPINVKRTWPQQEKFPPPVSRNPLSFPFPNSPLGDDVCPFPRKYGGFGGSGGFLF